MIKKRSLDYYVDTSDGNNWVLDVDKKHIYCIFHIEERLFEDKNGFIACRECNRIIMKERNKQ